jgi:hypothetical protein
VAVDLCLSGSIENATQQDVLVNRQLKHAVKIELFGTQEVVEGLSLGNGTREPIQDEPVLGIWLQNALGNYLNDQFVWNKLTTFHHRLGFSDVPADMEARSISPVDNCGMASCRANRIA